MLSLFPVEGVMDKTLLKGYPVPPSYIIHCPDPAKVTNKAARKEEDRVKVEKILLSSQVLSQDLSEIVPTLLQTTTAPHTSLTVSPHSNNLHNSTFVEPTTSQDMEVVPNTGHCSSTKEVLSCKEGINNSVQPEGLTGNIHAPDNETEVSEKLQSLKEDEEIIRNLPLLRQWFQVYKYSVEREKSDAEPTTAYQHMESVMNKMESCLPSANHFSEINPLLRELVGLDNVTAKPPKGTGTPEEPVTINSKVLVEKFFPKEEVNTQKNTGYERTKSTIKGETSYTENKDFEAVAHNISVPLHMSDEKVVIPKPTTTRKSPAILVLIVLIYGGWHPMEPRNIV